MKIIYSTAHRQHHPPFEIFEGGVALPVFENPDRMERIVAALTPLAWAEFSAPHDFGLAPILAVHAPDYVHYLQTALARWQTEGGQVKLTQPVPLLLGAAFPPRRSRHASRAIAAQAGYYSFDLSCPIVAGTWPAVYTAAQIALTGAALLEEGASAAFALCRPPGHHAGKDFAGGYCYLNNAAIAAQYLRQHSLPPLPLMGEGPGMGVAILDVDYHSGNGTQDIFYESAEVLTLSLHADPEREYPYFVGFADETGAGAGAGYHRNFPLPAGTGDEDYCRALAEALAHIRDFAPRYLVVSFGADTFAGDPLGDLQVTTAGFARMGEMIDELGLPTLVVMEGGYANDALGLNTVAFLSALAQR